MLEDDISNSVEYLQALHTIKINPLKANLKFKEYLEKYPRHYIAYCYYATTLIILGKFSEAEKTLNFLMNTYYKDKDVLANVDFLNFINREVLRNKLKLLCYQRRYEEFCDLYQKFRKTNDSLGEYWLNVAYFYCKNRLAHPSQENRNEFDFYIYRQIICYRKDDFIAHIQEHLYNHYTSTHSIDKTVFVPTFPINRVINEVKKKIPSDNKLCLDFYADTYVFKYNNCGYNGTKLINYFKVICFQDTNNIITLYPAEECEELPCTDLNYILKENKDYDYLRYLEQKRITGGELIAMNGKNYLVKKVLEKNKASLLEITSKDEAEVSFKFDKKLFYVKKDAIVSDCSNIKVIDRYGEDIIKEFEYTKRNKQNNDNKKHSRFQIGQVLFIDGMEKVIIEIYMDYLILIDQKKECSCVLKDDKIKILYNKSKDEVNFIKNYADYTNEKRIMLLKEKGVDFKKK